ncbi:MAG: flagellar protein FliS [Planctomycetota bacterium]
MSAKSSSSVNAYKVQSLSCNWTRIEALLQLYDRAVVAINGAEKALRQKDSDSYFRHFVDAQKTVLAIHSGLKPDEYDIAFNIARLLHFVMRCLEEQKFSDAAKVLGQLRDGFAAISSEAVELENAGHIPPMESRDEFTATA